MIRLCPTTDSLIVAQLKIARCYEEIMTVKDSIKTRYFKLRLLPVILRKVSVYARFIKEMAL